MLRRLQCRFSWAKSPRKKENKNLTCEPCVEVNKRSRYTQYAGNNADILGQRPLERRKETSEPRVEVSIYNKPKHTGNTRCFRGTELGAA